MREYVVAMFVKGDSAEAAVSFLQKLLEEAQDDESRKAIQHQIQRAELERDAIRLENAVALYRQRRLLAPFCLEQLVSDGLVPAIPQDPFGGILYLDEAGRVRSSVFPKRLDRPPTPAERERDLREYRAQTTRAVETNR
jgi:hypothetical protein